MQNSPKEIIKYLRQEDIEPAGRPPVSGEVFSFAQYAGRLKLARISETSAKSLIAAVPVGMDPDVRDLELTRGALRHITEAQQMGVDPAPYVSQAAKVALIEGRKKVGPFGEIKQVFKNLGEAIDIQRRITALNSSGSK